MLTNSEKEKIEELAASLDTFIVGNCGPAFWPYYLIEVLVKRTEEMERRIKDLEGLMSKVVSGSDIWRQ